MRTFSSNDKIQYANERDGGYMCKAAPALIDIDMNLQAACDTVTRCRRRMMFEALTTCTQGDTSRSNVAAASIQRASVRSKAILESRTLFVYFVRKIKTKVQRRHKPLP